MLEQFDERSRIAMAHNYLFQKAFNGPLKLSITMPMTELHSTNFGYNTVAKPTEAEGI